eukprot:scaffold54195_cov58-Attheya_sp.AAC.3
MLEATVFSQIQARETVHKYGRPLAYHRMCCISLMLACSIDFYPSSVSQGPSSIRYYPSSVVGLIIMEHRSGPFLSIPILAPAPAK